MIRNSMKIAILVLLHEFSDQQKNLILHLSKDFDVFVHVDKKSPVEPSNVSVNDRVHVLKKYPVYWGSYNQILATLSLFETSSQYDGGYDRYVLISGADLPLKTNSEIYKFFCGKGCDKNYFEYEKLPRESWKDENGGFDRIDFFFPNVKSHGVYNFWGYLSYGIINRINRLIVIPLLKRLGIKRRMSIDYYGGANWMDLTHSCIVKILEFVHSHQKFLRSFKYTRCADEIFFQTLICNYLPDVQIENACLRYVDFTTGPESPRILRMSDYEKIKGSRALFARKFNSKVDSLIIKKLWDDLKN